MKPRSILLLIACGCLAVVVTAVAAQKISYAHKYHDHAKKESPKMHTEVEFRPSTMKELERFHGHVGPFVVFGSHMGEYAVTKYDMPRYFGVTVEVECPAQPPHSCLIDGLMVSTGATYGKKNIHHTHAKDIRVIISDDETGAQVIFTIKKSALDMLKKWEEENMPVPERGAKSFAMKSEDLFDIEYVKGAVESN